MTGSAFRNQIQNRNFLSGVAFKFNLAKFPKVDFSQILLEYQS